MIQTGSFVDIPFSTVPAEKRDALFVLLDEEIILRRDIPDQNEVFPDSDGSLNFTFDEFRDFLIAQYLVRKSWKKNASDFQAFVQLCQPKDSQILEGIKRFLFYASRKANNHEFYQYYQHEPWYADVYSVEVFNVDTSLLLDDDKTRVTDLLSALEKESQEVARRLAVRWNSRVYPTLGLGLLIDFVTSSPPSFYSYLLLETFIEKAHINDGSSVKAFCHFISDSILPDFDPSASSASEYLFKFLVLLLPCGGGEDLNSDAGLVYRSILENHREFGLALLEGALSYPFSELQPYLWRLFSVVAPELESDCPLIERAREEEHRLRSEESTTRREIKRFLSRIGRKKVDQI
ncbi:MAG: hypothetical protein R3F07_15940 [Opitutaceae bacterium]